MKYSIPFNKPFIAGKELYYIAQSVINGHTSGDGPYTEKSQALMETQFNAQKVLLTHSCTAALEMSAILCDIGPGDEVIMPSFTFVSTANAFALRGAKIKFVDIRKDTLNIDESKIEKSISKKTKAIVPVHYAGVSCEMEKIMEIARSHDLYVVEDAAQGVNSTYNGQYLGTIGDIGTYSFHETKNFISGEGGAIVINNDKLIERAEIVRERGTNKSSYLRGETSKYSWVDIGSSYLPSDMISAFLFAQLENANKITIQRNAIWDFYYKSLIPLANDGYLRLPFIPRDCKSNSHLFFIILNDEKIRNDLMNFMKSNSILCVFHYVPLHTSNVGCSMGYSEGQLPVTESISSRLLRLPLYFEITRKEQEKVIDKIYDFFKS